LLPRRHLELAQVCHGVYQATACVYLIQQLCAPRDISKQVLVPCGYHSLQQAGEAGQH
jgi:hypothetical protein